MKFEKQWNAVKGFFAKIGKRNALIALSVLLIAGAIALNVTLLVGNDNDGYDGYDQPSGGTVSGKGEDYFASCIVSRERSRSEAMEVLQSVVDEEGSDEAVRAQALVDLTKLASDIENEANIEMLIISKGYEKCVAVINGDKINIVVQSDGLNVSEVAQINTIVYEQAGILPVNITIIEKTA